jgi:4-amino-4-deoxy-L-arabinose transferase-like glycosyltransferase
MKDFFERLGTLALLFFLILCKAALMILLINYSDIGLGPDEAQYWTWSKDLSWGYYSKPPGIAWQIWLGTHYFGDTELGVRFMSVVLACLYPILIYFLAWICQLSPRTCFWAAVMMALTPLGIASSFFAITDGGMILFWILACMAIAKPLNEQRTPSYWLVGLFIGLGALFKWPIYILWAFILCLFPFAHQLINRHFFVGVLISLIGLIPSIIWNFQHDWVTFRHVFSTLFVPQTASTVSIGIFNGNFWDFLGAQLALMSPILFILLLMSFWFFCKELRQMPFALSFCGALCFSLLGIFLVLSAFKKMQGNWCDFAYPTGIVFLSWFSCERVPKAYPWMIAGVVLSVFLCVLAFSIPILQTTLPFSTTFKINPFKHNLGWNILKKDLALVGYNPETEFLFADRYQMSSLLSFYSPQQKRAYFLNLQGARKNQFSFWPGLKEEQVGKTGYFVVVENAPHLDKLNENALEDYHSLLAHYFKHVEFLGIKPLFTIHGVSVKEAAIFKCMDYNGELPTEPELF